MTNARGAFARLALSVGIEDAHPNFKENHYTRNLFRRFWRKTLPAAFSLHADFGEKAYVQHFPHLALSYQGDGNRLILVTFDYPSHYRKLFNEK